MSGPARRSAEWRAITEEVASTVRHDLRNKLGAIQSAAFYLAKKCQKSDLWAADVRFPAFFKLIEEQLQEAEKILSDRLPSPSLNPDAVAPVALGDCAERARSSAAAEGGGGPPVALERAAEVIVWADASEVAAAIELLIDNAVEAAGQASAVKVVIFGEGDFAVARVADTGPGFDPAMLRSGPAAFKTTKRGHVGLGLAVAARIARRHRGELRIGNLPGGGAGAELRLPRMA